MSSQQRIWLIGGGTGIGKSLAIKMALAGGRVVISGRNLDTLSEVAEEWQQSRGAIADGTASGEIIPLAYDVTDDEASVRVASRIEALLGGLDTLVVCAGRCEYVDNAELTTDMFRRVYDVNVFGLVNALSASLPLLKSSGQKPHIVGVASLSAVVGLPRAEAYGSSKAASIYLLESLRLDLAADGVDVTVVNPGFVKTPMTDSNDFPMPFLMQTDEAADCILAGVIKRKRTVNFPLRLWLMLKVASLFPGLWYGVIGPRLVRSSPDNN